jgi:hypothetical protein
LKKGISELNSELVELEETNAELAGDQDEYK